jgi:hypothetical protein
MPLYKLRRDDSWILLLHALSVLPRSAEECRAPVRRLLPPARVAGLAAACFVTLQLRHYYGGELWWDTARQRPRWAMALLNMPRMKLSKSDFLTNI